MLRSRITRRDVLAGAGSAAFPVRGLAGARLTVFAAASLKGALDAVADDWMAGGRAPVRLSFAASSTLARQIQHGAPADVFLSANTAWMNLLDADGLLRPGTRRDLLSNRLVVISHEPVAADRSDLSDLPRLLGDGRLAVALIDAVPAGIYARSALEATGLWPALANRLAQTDNVRTALALVARGEAPFGIVYATDAAAEPAVHVAAQIPEAAHPPIRYPLAVVDASTHRDAMRFADALSGPDATRIFRTHGFDIPAPA